MLRRWRSSTLALALVACVVVAISSTGCKQGTTRPCMTMGGHSQLVDEAAALRVEVYDGSVACPALTGGKPLVDQVFAKGTPIALDVKAGKRTIVLTAYSDAGATQPIGRACTTANLGGGDSLCFDLTVEPVGTSDGGADLAVRDGGGKDGGADLAVPGDLGGEADLSVEPMPDLLIENPDLLPVPDLLPECTMNEHCGSVDLICCNNKCISGKTLTDCGSCGAVCGSDQAAPSCATGTCVLNCTTGFDDCDGNKANGCEANLNTNTSHCGQCARACSTTQALALACTDGKCTSTCNPGYANCTQPTAPVADNGCEISTTTSVSNCGGCNNVCTTAANNTARSCVEPGTCQYTCATNRQDCNAATAPNLDGCECEGGGCCGTGCQTKHDNGTGQNWYDCVALDTFDITQAKAACNALGLASCYETQCSTDGASGVICAKSTDQCACWQYAASNANKAQIGRVYWNTSWNGCFCPSGSAAQWH